ncbi:MAG: LLM class flavin-dependent oxidoreductase [Chromatiales bacterium]|jgi:alkanesulfonate monooxygenase SsuD/methylene tetrahydromethanopterin reductase-like flavin-dependent oxidoreductase (luciferase family)|nr:LLM class flavin-dependent oxidoreductase [Chromatiales bacterium]
MQFGIMMRGQFPAADSLAERFDELMAQARLIDELGYDSITKGAHYSAGPLQDFQQIPFLSRLAGEAPRCRLNTGVCLLPLHKPLDIAEQVATLDVMTNGKVIFGCGVGYRDVEFKAFGMDRSERGRRFEENLDCVKRLWAGEVVSMKASHFELQEAMCSALPVQRPHPPIWIGGSADAVIRRAARMGSCWYIGPNDRLAAIEPQLEVYKRALEEAGRDFPAEFPIRREVFVAKTREEAYRLTREPIMNKYKAYFSWGLGQSRPGATDELGMPFEELLEDRFLIGSPDDVTEQILKFRQRLGVNHIIMSMHWPGMDVARSMEAMALLAEEVMPRVREAS